MMKHAVLLQFKDDATKEQIAAALNGLAAIVDLSQSGHLEKVKAPTPPTEPYVNHRWVPHTQPSDLIQTFNPDHGYPTFYIP